MGIIHTFATVAFRFGQMLINPVLHWLNETLVLQLYWFPLRYKSHKSFYLSMNFLRNFFLVKQEQQKCLFNFREILSSPSLLNCLNSFYSSLWLTFTHFICFLSLSVLRTYFFLALNNPFYSFLWPSRFSI